MSYQDWVKIDPCCVLWHCVDCDGRMYTYRELYVRNMRAEEVARKICELSCDETISYTVASPDMWQQRGVILALQGGFEGGSVAEIFQHEGVPLTPADNSRIAGWQKLRSYLAVQPDGLPLWQVFPSCVNLIKTLPALTYDTRVTEDASGYNDHAPEALRYGIMSRPGKSAFVMPSIQAYDPLAVSIKPQDGFMGT